MSKIGLLQTTLDPVHYETMPPIIDTRTSFAKKFTVQGSWTVDDSALNPLGAKVSTRSGLLMWFPWRGINTSIFRFGIVKKGTTKAAGWLGFYDVTSPNEVPLLYQSGSNTQVTVSPDASSDFSFTRLVAGCVSMVSNAFAIGQTAITGTLAAGVPNDTRDVTHNVDGQTFAADSLVQQSVTTKDAFLNMELALGGTMLLGSDIPSKFSPPNRDGVNTINAGRGVVAVPMHAPGVGFISLPAFGSKTLTQEFFSPYGITLDNMTSDSVTPSNHKLDHINLLGTIDFDINLVMAFVTFPVLPPTGVQLVALTFITQDMFALVAENGDVVFAQVGATRYSHIVNANAGSHVGDVYRSHHEPIRPPDASITNEAANTGQYLGTLVTVVFANMSDNTIDIEVGQIVFGTLPRTIYEDGELGPVRVLRYDGASELQQIKVFGTLLVECVPEGSIAPYVTSTEKVVPKTISLNMLPFMCTLYNSNSPFKRIYLYQDWLRICRDIVPSLSMNTLMEWAAHESGEQAVQNIQEAAEAGGFWDSISSGINTVGDAINTGVNTVGNAAYQGARFAANVLPIASTLSQMHASGQFRGSIGAGQYRGEESISAGQFGGVYHTGQYGSALSAGQYGQQASYGAGQYGSDLELGTSRKRYR